MRQEHILSILYDLAMVLSGETRSGPLVDQFLQRLMFHTGFPCGHYLSHISPAREDGRCAAYLENSIGDPEFTARCGQRLSLSETVMLGDSSLIEDTALLAANFGEANAWHTMLRLRVGEDSIFVLLSPEPLRSDLPFTSMFDPVLRNFTRVLDLCRANEAHVEELEMANRELEAFCHSVSHDLRTPLRGIDGFSLALLEDCASQLDREGMDYLRRVRNGVQRMGTLIDDLLKLSRMTQAPLSRQPIDMRLLATRTLDELRENEPHRHVEVHIGEGLKVTADPALLGLALDNLLGNAWKYTGKKAHAIIEFGVAREDGETVFYIRDNGAGFDMQYADMLFAPFQRLHKAEEFSGTGVGLATVQRVIQRHGGEIWAEAEVGKGATFFFTLPLQMKDIHRQACKNAETARPSDER